MAIGRGEASALGLRTMNAVTGISDHCGWAELVTVGVREGEPAVLERRRAELVEEGLASAPYHHEGLALPIDEASEIVERTRASVAKRCREVVESLRDSFGVEAVAIQESPYAELPTSLSDVLASYTMTCAADGMMYREEFAAQASAAGLEVFRFARKSDPIATAAESVGCGAAELAAYLAEYGKLIGAPWRKEHKQMAAAALRVLADRHDLAKWAKSI